MGWCSGSAASRCVVCRILASLLDGLNNRVGDQNLSGEVPLQGVVFSGLHRVLQDLHGSEFFFLQIVLFFFTDVRFADKFLVGNQFVVEGVETTGCFQDGRTRRLPLEEMVIFLLRLFRGTSRAPCSAMIGMCLSERFAILCDSRGSWRRRQQDMALMSAMFLIRSQFVCEFLGDSEFHEPLLRCALYYHPNLPRSAPTLYCSAVRRARRGSNPRPSD